MFVHNAINHAHWKQRLTSAKEEERDQGRKNIEHCLRVSHAAGGSGVLIVVGRGDDGPAEEIEERAGQEIKKLLPLAASLGQMILVENVWNQMMYDHDKPPEQTPERFIKFVDSFNSPWVGMYYDVGNHWKYGQPGDWIRAFGRRCVKMDAKGFSRANEQVRRDHGRRRRPAVGRCPQGARRDRLHRLGDRRGRRRRCQTTDHRPRADAEGVSRMTDSGEGVPPLRREGIVPQLLRGEECCRSPVGPECQNEGGTPSGRKGKMPSPRRIFVLSPSEDET